VLFDDAFDAVQLENFVINDAKRLLQQYRPRSGHREVSVLERAAVVMRPFGPASSTASASAASVTERPHMMQSKVCKAACAPKLGDDRTNRIDIPQCGQAGEG
jgi:hypothetical protein